MQEYLFSQFVPVVKGKGTIHQDLPVKYILTDSRRIIAVEKTVFIAIIGERNDGHDYIPGLIEKGIKNFIVSKGSTLLEKSGVNFIQVKDCLLALQQIAAFHRTSFHYPVVAVTGSNGKTIVKEWIYQALSDNYKIIRNPRSYNSQLGVPLSVWLMSSANDLAVFEAGISLPGEMIRLESIIKPEIGIFTTIGDAHQEGFRSLVEKIDEKLILFSHAKTLIYCKDHEAIHARVLEKLGHLTLFSWSYQEGAEVMLSDVRFSKGKTIFNVSFKGVTREMLIPFSDKASLENIMHVICLMLYLGIELERVSSQLSKLTAVEMRLEIKHGINNCFVINDAYNSDVNSLAIALDHLNLLSQHLDKTLILSDILQSGKNPDELYKQIASLVEQKNISSFIGIGQELYSRADFFSCKKSFYKTTDEFIHHFNKNLFKNQNILIKGARSFAFERISRLLEKQLHQTVMEINLNALVDNLNYFKSLLQPSTKMMVMVKAFSYGSGIHEIANLLQYQKVDYLGVAYTDEGVIFRSKGINSPIIVMNPEYDSFDTMIDYQLEPEIFSFSGLSIFNEVLGRKGMEKYPVHIKLDTGMHRLGFGQDVILLLINKIKEYKNLYVKSVFTHLAASDEPVHDDYTRQQISTFEQQSSRISRELGYPVLRHVLNSAGIERFPEAQIDMVRLGIGLYGISVVNSPKVTHIGTLKSYIAQIRKLTAKETVGYGRKGTLERDSSIAVIPIGYADGLNRLLSNGKGYFMIKGKKAPLVGNICMDLCMVDITGIEAVEGDEVIIMGREPSVNEIAETLGTIPYEVLTSISPRVKRVFVQE